MIQTVEKTKEEESEILKFIDSVNINEIDASIDRINSDIEILFDESILSECSVLTIKKFIKLSIHLNKYFHKQIVQKLQNLDPNDATNLEDDIDTLNGLYSSIVSLSDESIEFCNYFHQEESENDIFDLLMDEKLLSILNEEQTNDITSWLQEVLQDVLFMALLNISKAYDRNREKWNSLNAYQKLLELSQKTNRKEVILTCIMILGNIASDEDLNNFSTSPKGFEFLTVEIDRFSNALKDKLYLNDN